MVSDAIFWDAVSVSLMREERFLPLAEAVQGLVCMVVNLQVGLQ